MADFPAAGDWVMAGFSRSTTCWAKIVAKDQVGVRLKVVAMGGIQIPAGSPHQRLFVPWGAIDYIQGADGPQDEA